MVYLLIGYILGVLSVVGMIEIANRENQKRKVVENGTCNKGRTRLIYEPVNHKHGK